MISVEATECRKDEEKETAFRNSAYRLVGVGARSRGGREEGGLTPGRHTGRCCDVAVAEWAGLGG